jgi:hypothetical protein
MLKGQSDARALGNLGPRRLFDATKPKTFSFSQIHARNREEMEWNT